MIWLAADHMDNAPLKPSSFVFALVWLVIVGYYSVTVLRTNVHLLVRLYITGSSFSNSGSSNGVEGRLVQLAAATARTHNANENPSTEFPSCTSYFCPRHEAAGAASMLLRRALVSKV